VLPNTVEERPNGLGLADIDDRAGDVLDLAGHGGDGSPVDIGDVDPRVVGREGFGDRQPDAIGTGRHEYPLTHRPCPPCLRRPSQMNALLTATLVLELQLTRRANPVAHSGQPAASVAR
jgi:hypothetical protein